MKQPKLACCNFISDPADLRAFACEHAFDGIDWSFHRHTLPQSDEDVREVHAAMAALQPLEIRYHIALRKTDLGDADPESAREAMRVLRRVCRLVADLRGKIVTVHVGLGHDSTLGLSWERTIDSLGHLVKYAESLGLRLCLENLAWGWTSRPDLFEKMVRKADPWTTLDIGHARVSPSVVSREYDVADFVAPQAERCLNAHIYHEENENGHIPPCGVGDLRERLCLLLDLPHCDWWVLELREKVALLETLAVVRDFLADRDCAGRDHGGGPQRDGKGSVS